MNYELILGLEVHIQLNTKTKMFCACRNDPFGADKPNSHVCPVCLGLPGALPVPNKKAIKKAQKIAYALGCELSKNIIFERKNYFYPDLPKGYQITCPHYPVGIKGRIDLSYWEKNLKIRFREMHLEEDTAKSIHKGGKTWIDFNKSGVPLLEIVTEPDFRDIDIAVKFCKEMQLISRYLKISEANMEKGQMRLEANISVRKRGSTELPDYRIELKNINSFAFMKKALLYELRRQVRALENGEVLVQETRGFDEDQGKTFSQRGKEEAHDYRYFPEPDIPPLVFNDNWVQEITTLAMRYPMDIRKDLKKKGISSQYIEVFVRSPKKLKKVEVLKKVFPSKSYTSLASIIIDNSRYKGLSVDRIIQDIKQAESEEINLEEDLKPIVESVIKANPKAVQDYKSGNVNSIQFLIGQVMKLTKGKANPTKVKELLSKVK